MKFSCDDFLGVVGVSRILFEGEDVEVTVVAVGDDLTSIGVIGWVIMKPLSLLLG